MIDHPGFLADILENPEDDVPRLIYADWLQDNGQPQRAEFIRVQIELSKLGSNFRSTATDQLLAREKKLWGYLPALVGIMWDFKEALPGWAVLLPRDGGNGLTDSFPWAIVRRGFIQRVRCTVRVWYDLGPQLVSRQPIRSLRLVDLPFISSPDRLLEGEFIHRIDFGKIESRELGDLLASKVNGVSLERDALVEQAGIVLLDWARSEARRRALWPCSPVLQES